MPWQPFVYQGFDWGGFILTILFLVVIVAAIGALFSSTRHWTRHTPYPPGPPSTGRPDHDEALAILERRFATGEIDEEEFVRRRQVLRDGKSD